MPILGVDVSHWQGYPNWLQVKASARQFVVMKATESTNYVDPGLAANRKAAHAAGLIVGFYHFARATDPAAEATFFVRNVGALQVGEFLVLDWEVPGANAPGWCKAWLDAVYRATGVRPLIYMNQSAVAGSNWASVAPDYGLWLAKYDQSTVQPAVSWWGAPAMKQFYDKGVVPGIAGGVDVDVFYGTAQQLLAYGKGGTAPTPAPTPTVQEDDMAIIEHAQRGIALLGPGYYRMLPPNEVGPALQAHGLTATTKMPDAAAFDLAVSAHTSSANLGDIARWLRGGDPNKDNITLLWEMLRGGNPDGENNFNWLAAKVDALAGAVKALQSGGVDPSVVSGLVLAGLDGAQLSVSAPPASPAAT